MELGVVIRRQTRRLANGAGDIDGLPANATNEVMVVVANPVFVTGRRTGRLNAPNDALLHQQSERVINRLARNRADVGANAFGNHVGGGMWPGRHHPQDRQALGGDLDTMFSKDFRGVRVHASVIHQILDPVQYLPEPNKKPRSKLPAVLSDTLGEGPRAMARTSLPFDRAVHPSLSTTLAGTMRPAWFNWSAWNLHPQTNDLSRGDIIGQIHRVRMDLQPRVIDWP